MEYCCGCLTTASELWSPTEDQIDVYQGLVFSKMDSNMKQLNVSLFRFCTSCGVLLEQIKEFQVSCEKAAIFLLTKYTLKQDTEGQVSPFVVKQEQYDAGDHLQDEDYGQEDDDERLLNIDSIVKVEVSEVKLPLIFPRKFDSQKKMKNSLKSKNVGTKKKNLLETKGSVKGYCHFCDLSFPSHSFDPAVTTFKEHLLKEHATPNETDQGITCKLCNAKLNSTKTITHHFKWNHVVEDAELKCPYCENRFRNTLTLKTHIKYYHKMVPKPFICDLCDKRFKQKNDIIRHMSRKHMNESKCERCHSSFDSQEDCRRHKKDCRAMFICHICGSKLLSKISLKNHIVGQHLPPPPCDICGKEFKRKQDLDHHKVMEHSQKNFVCDVCARTFHTQNGLNSHFKFTHLKQENRYSRTKQWCEICKKWESSTTKSNHELKARLGRRYQCTECELAFFHAHQLKRHMFTHSKLRPYNCKMCTAGYYHVSYLKAHYQRSHGSEYLGAILKQPDDHIRAENQNSDEGVTPNISF